MAGATGLVGREVLAALLTDRHYSAVHSIGRREVAVQHPKLVQHVQDLSVPVAPSTLGSIDDVFICLGTTIKAAGSREAFRAIDFHAVVALARAMLNAVQNTEHGTRILRSGELQRRV